MVTILLLKQTGYVPVAILKNIVKFLYGLNSYDQTELMVIAHSFSKSHREHFLKKFITCDGFDEFFGLIASSAVSHDDDATDRRLLQRHVLGRVGHLNHFQLAAPKSNTDNDIVHQ